MTRTLSLLRSAILWPSSARVSDPAETIDRRSPCAWECGVGDPRTTWASAWLVLAIVCCAPLGAEDSPAVQRLAQYGLEPTTASLGTYLAALHPTPEQQQAAQKLVERLGAEDFAERDAATRELTRLTGIKPLLEHAIAADDFEVRWRAKRILDQADRDSRLVLSTVLTVIQERKLSGLAAGLFAALPYANDEQLRAQLRSATITTAGPPDVPFLRQQLASTEPKSRALALATLAAVAGPDTVDDALTLLLDSAEPVQAAAARALADQGRRECLPALIRLLESPETTIRVQAIQTLRPLTGEHFGYTVYESPEKRAAAIEKWRAWLGGEGASAALHFPVQDVPLELGRVVVCDHGQNLLIEFDTAGKKVWQTNVGLQPWACLGLANGHRLVGSYQERSVVEYDEAGQEVWRVEGLPGGPTSIQRLENGNTLIACTEGAQVVEIDPGKKTVWSAQLDGRPVDARRLEDGNTLVALQHAQKVVELDPAGKQIWELTGVGTAFSAQRLAGGNTLVCALSLKTVREYDRSGKIVWEKGAFTNPYSAQRLAGGNTLVVDTTGLIEIDPQGSVTHRVSLQNISRAWRY